MTTDMKLMTIEGLFEEINLLNVAMKKNTPHPLGNRQTRRSRIHKIKRLLSCSARLLYEKREMPELKEWCP